MVSRIKRFARSKWTRRVVWILGVTLAVVGALALGVKLFLGSDWGRGVIAARVESLASDQIAGSMRVGGIDSVATDHVVAHDIRFFAPGGALVIEARKVDVDIRLLDLLRGRIEIASGDVRGGTVYLATDARGNLGLDKAFRMPRGSSSGGGQTIDLDKLHVSGVSVRVSVSGVPDVRVSSLNCVARIWTPEAGAKARLHATNLTGHVAVSTPVPIRMELTRGMIQYDGAHAQLARVEVDGTMGGSPAGLEATVSMRHGDPLVVARLTVAGTSGWFRALPLIVQGTLADVASSSFELHVQTSP